MAYRLADELAARIPGDGDKAATTDEEEQKEAAFRRLETLGYRVGQGLVERYEFGFSFIHVFMLGKGLDSTRLGKLGWGK